MPDDRTFYKRGSWFRCDVPTPGPRGRRSWPSLPRCPGVYAIYEHGRLVYIGSSVDLLKRVRSHFASGGRWSDFDGRATIKFSPIGAGWITRERSLVKRLKPRDNREWNSDHVIEQSRLYPVPDSHGGSKLARVTRREYLRLWGRS